MLKKYSIYLFLLLFYTRSLIFFEVYKATTSQLAALKIR